MPPSQLRILVPLQDPATESDLVRLAASLALPPWGELHLTHVVTPDSSPSPDIDQQIQDLARIALDMGIGAIPHIEKGDDVTQVVNQAISRWNCNMMVMGWKAKVERDAILASANRTLAKSLKIDTLIFKNRNFQPASRIMVPTAGGSHSMVSLQVANDLAGRWNSQLDIVRVARDGSSKPDDPLLDRYCAQLLEDTHLQLQLLGIDAPINILPAPEVIPPIVARAQQSDLVVLGASNDWRQDDYLAGSIPDEIASQVPCSVLMVRSAGNGAPFLGNILWENTIRLNMRPTDKWDAITQMIDALVEEKQIPQPERDKVLAAAFERERQSSTAMGHETAIPHAPIPDLPALIGCMAICPDGVDFEGPKDEPVHFIFLLLTPQQNYRNYIPVLAQIATLIRPEETRKAFLDCQIPSEVTALLRAQEQH